MYDILLSHINYTHVYKNGNTPQKLILLNCGFLHLVTSSLATILSSMGLPDVSFDIRFSWHGYGLLSDRYLHPRPLHWARFDSYNHNLKMWPSTLVCLCHRVKICLRICAVLFHKRGFYYFLIASECSKVTGNTLFLAWFSFGPSMDKCKLHENTCTVEFWEWISNFIPHFPGHVVFHSCWD